MEVGARAAKEEAGTAEELPEEEAVAEVVEAVAPRQEETRQGMMNRIPQTTIQQRSQKKELIIFS